MNRRRFFAGLLATGAFAASGPARAGVECMDGWGTRTCTAGIARSLIDQAVVDDEQHASQWCWAACISMIFQYYGHPVDQERIVEETFGTIVDMPGEPEDILRALNRRWKDDDGDSFRSSGDQMTANLMTAAQDLAEDQPLIIGALAHATVLTAMTYTAHVYGHFQHDALTVRDPMPGRNQGRRVLSGAEFYNIQFLARVRVR
ncbi:MAG TPA: papain-like cysteine protease family protein [Myxococcota bacterium]|nr:papain-like cysteine protease family protein [Myxococcota bacterium]